jgi:predicted MFS family arabinose efflux permease
MLTDLGYKLAAVGLLVAAYALGCWLESLTY